MRDTFRIPRILDKIYDLWIAYPDLRLCQLLTNIGIIAAGGDAYYLEDDLVERCLDAYARQHRRRAQAVGKAKNPKLPYSDPEMQDAPPTKPSKPRPPKR